MTIPQMLASAIQFISEAAVRIFGPTDDAYPVIGVQPFTGGIYKQSSANSW